MNKGFKGGRVSIDIDYLIYAVIEDNGEFSRFKREQDKVDKGVGSIVSLRKYDDSSTKSNCEVMSMIRLLGLNAKQQDNLNHIAKLYGKRMVKVPEFSLSEKDKSNIIRYIYNANQEQKYWSAQVLSDYWKRKEA